MAETQIFVKISHYKDALHTVGLIKDKLSEANDTLAKIKELNSQEAQEIESWDAKLKDVESKIEAVDHILFEPAQ